VELRQYWRVLTDRAILVVIAFLVALGVAAASVYLIPQTSTPYQAALSVAVKPRLATDTATPYYSTDYYSYIASEYANDDLIAVVESDDFIQGLRARLPTGAGGAASGSVKGTKAHRVVEFTVTSTSAEGAMSLAQGIADTLTSPQTVSKFFDLFANEGQTVTVVQPPRIVSLPAGHNALLNLAARALVGLACGIGLAFLVDYLDDSVRSEDVAPLLGWPIVAEIPDRGLPAIPRGASAAPRDVKPALREHVAK